MDIEQTTLSILGDSYSTYTDWIPKDYDAWYSDDGFDDIGSVEQTWWHMLCKEKNFRLLTNCSYSASTICNTGYDELTAQKISFITRMKRELGPDRPEKPDVLIVFGATNDCWAGSPIGEVQYEDWTEEDLKQFAPAFCYMMHNLKEWNPDTKIYNVVNDLMFRKMKKIIAKVCEYYDITNIELKKIQKVDGHPNAKGMLQIKEQIAEMVV